MVYYTLYVDAYENYDVAPSDYLTFDRKEFFEILDILKCLAFYYLPIRELRLVQYGFCRYKRGSTPCYTVRLNSFKITYPGNNMAYGPIFTLEKDN